jgi:hypothetical protein
MNPKKQSRRKGVANKLEPIDWREFANDAVLNGNMSTLYRRPPAEDASAYASPEAMIEIEKRVKDTGPVEARRGPGEPYVPTAGSTPISHVSIPVGTEPTEGMVPTVSPEPTVGLMPAGPTSAPALNVAVLQLPTAPLKPTVGLRQAVGSTRPNESAPTEGFVPTVGLNKNKKVKPIRTVQDAITLAGQVLYKAMLGAGDAPRTSCTKGYRQLAAETHLDKDTVRDLIVEFKQKGILHETATYDPDTRLSKTYEVLAPQAVLQAWRESGVLFVTAGRQRPLFCSAAGDHLTFIPTVGTIPTP